MPRDLDDSYGLPPGSSRDEKPAPDLPYAPADPMSSHPRIGLIGCGGISIQHLRAYRDAGYDVAMLCDRSEGKAREAQKKYYPEADVSADFRDVLRRDDIDVVDLAAHPGDRAAMYEPAIEAGKHILSQKPFVTDIDFGLSIVEQAEKKGVRLAVNQNGRWAPHWSWIRQAIASGFLGEVTSVRTAVNWDHNWVAGSVFEDIHSLILYDFGIHWFDIVSCFMGPRTPLRVYASTARAPTQRARPPLLSQALIEYERGQAELFFDANTLFGEQDCTFVAGTRGTATSCGPDLNAQSVTLATADGRARPVLEGKWFPDGFHGTMGELLRAVEEKREPLNSARNNLKSLELCFAAIASAATHLPVEPGAVRKLQD
ncbi:MAG: Gfo/Idh/MocA family oxidoreductase [Spirochaetia bacterium]